jgi:hypothetical protein
MNGGEDSTPKCESLRGSDRPAWLVLNCQVECVRPFISFQVTVPADCKIEAPLEQWLSRSQFWLRSQVSHDDESTLTTGLLQIHAKRIRR